MTEQPEAFSPDADEPDREPDPVHARQQDDDETPAPDLDEPEAPDPAEPDDDDFDDE